MPSREPASRQPVPSRSAKRTGDLVLGGVLAMVLLIACILWEAMSGAAVPDAVGAVSGNPEISATGRPSD